MKRNVEYKKYADAFFESGQFQPAQFIHRINLGETNSEIYFLGVRLKRDEEGIHIIKQTMWAYDPTSLPIHVSPFSAEWYRLVSPWVAGRSNEFAMKIAQSGVFDEGDLTEEEKQKLAYYISKKYQPKITGASRKEIYKHIGVSLWKFFGNDFLKALSKKFLNPTIGTAIYAYNNPDVLLQPAPLRDCIQYLTSSIYKAKKYELGFSKIEIATEIARRNSLSFPQFLRLLELPRRHRICILSSGASDALIDVCYGGLPAYSTIKTLSKHFHLVTFLTQAQIDNPELYQDFLKSSNKHGQRRSFAETLPEIDVLLAKHRSFIDNVPHVSTVHKLVNILALADLNKPEGDCLSFF